MEVGVESLVTEPVLFTETIWCWIVGINGELVLYVKKGKKILPEQST